MEERRRPGVACGGGPASSSIENSVVVWSCGVCRVWNVRCGDRMVDLIYFLHTPRDVPASGQFIRLFPMAFPSPLTFPAARVRRGRGAWARVACGPRGLGLCASHSRLPRRLTDRRRQWLSRCSSSGRSTAVARPAARAPWTPSRGASRSGWWRIRAQRPGVASSGSCAPQGLQLSRPSSADAWSEPFARVAAQLVVEEARHRTRL